MLGGQRLDANFVGYFCAIGSQKVLYRQRFQPRIGRMRRSGRKSPSVRAFPGADRTVRSVIGERHRLCAPGRGVRLTAPAPFPAVPAGRVDAKLRTTGRSRFAAPAGLDSPKEWCRRTTIPPRINRCRTRRCAMADWLASAACLAPAVVASGRNGQIRRAW